MRKLFFYVVFVCGFISCRQKPHHDKNAYFGIDVSQFQGAIDWNTVATQKKFSIRFVIVRATMGADREDTKFQYNFKEAKSRGYIVGAYHYYDPNENSTDQAKNYLNSISISVGDFHPILDIERLSKIQSKDKLVVGIKRWLAIVEKRYGVKPIIYTSLSYWQDYLKDDLSEYPVWLAAYSLDKRDNKEVKKAKIHQFTKEVKIPGIKENVVDGDDIKKEILESIIFKK